MAEATSNCLLGKAGTSPYCKNTCGTCGWNPKVAEERNAEIKANGLTEGSDGLHRLIIRKEVPTDDSNP